MAEGFTLSIDAAGIGVLTWDSAALGRAGIATLERLVDEIAENAAVKAAVLVPPKGARTDLADVQAMIAEHRAAWHARGAAAAAAALAAEAGALSRLCRRIETADKPFVAALEGTVSGAAFALALACRRRVASADARVGLPDAKLGVPPLGGAIARVLRRTALADGMPLLLKGEMVTAERAKALTLIDRIVPAGTAPAAAIQELAASPPVPAPWDVEGFRVPGGGVWSKAGMATWPAANALYRRDTYDNYPALRAVMQAAYEGLQLAIDNALSAETRQIAHALAEPRTAAMLRSLGFSQKELRGGARRPKTVPAVALRRIGILGAGFMGGGIAAVAARAGIDVVLIDRDEAAAAKGKDAIARRFADAVAKGRLDEAASKAALARIAAGADYAVLAGVDLVVEAVFEDRAVKADVTAKAQAVVPDVVFGSNTSTLPITSLAQTAKDPERFIGIHFFSPVERMDLVEIIVGERTGDRALATALDFVSRIGKTPIVVNDTRGFYANRCVLNYLREGHRMLLEGIPPALIENAARAAGMPVGPLSLTDEVAVDLTLHILKAAEADLGPQAVDQDQKRLLGALVEGEGRLGRKSGGGFYDYPQGSPKRLWPGLAAYVAKPLSPEAVEALDVEEIKFRLLAVQSLEAARCVEEKVITDVREADVGSILGFGFAPFTGGTLSAIDLCGTAAFAARCRELADRLGPRFTPPALLVEMAGRGETFYGRFAPPAAPESLPPQEPSVKIALSHGS